MGSMSGAAQSQVSNALKYLGFLSEGNHPQDALREFVASDGEQRKKLLRDVLHRAYPFIFAASFDLANATGSLLREAFEENTTATGETVTRCIAFFKEAATDAGITVSRYIIQKKARNGVQRKRPMAKKAAESGQDGSSTSCKATHDGFSSSSSIEAQNSLLLWGLFQRLPKPGSIWPQEKREQWTQTLNNVLALEYREQ